MNSLKVQKGPFGYYIEHTDRLIIAGVPEKGSVAEMITESQRTPLHVQPALDGVEIKFDNSVPMVVTDINGRKLCVKFDDKIQTVWDPSDPTVEVTEFDVNQDSMFFFLTAGVPEKA